MATLEKAILIATQAHRYQQDKSGRPYILHPLRVMLGMETEQEMIAAVLHDVVEDNKHWSFERLGREGFPADIIEILDRLTRRSEEPYEEFVLRVAQHPVARKIKLADLRDNMDITRLDAFDDATSERLQRYHRAWQMLNDPPPES
jgi:(p)ppGpp synthase/HD superfamily hydrolase